jgi:hypothetical protein
MHLPTLADFGIFGAWDGALLSLWLFVAGALCRTLARAFRRHGSTDPSFRVVYAVGTALIVIAVAGMVAAWLWLPHHARPGVWGVAGIGGIVLSFVGAMPYADQVFAQRRR